MAIKSLSEMEKVFIIAEAGVNHNGDLEHAKKLIDEAAKSGADAVKFQTFMAESLVSKLATKADYQRQTTDSTESQFEMLKKLELDEKSHKELIKHCKEKEIVFITTPFDNDSIVLLKKYNLPICKIPSGEITNLPYLRAVATVSAKILLSTGMATLGEIEAAIQILNDNGATRENITLFHCTTEYPAPISEVNLKAIQTLRQTFQIDVGYSDHTLGIEVSLAAVALGASVIEKHFTLDRRMKGPDHKASLEPSELKTLVQSIRNIEIAMGTGIKKPTFSEIKNKAVVRKSIVAKKDIQKGEVFSDQNITTKRPGSGISPMRWDEIIGRKATRHFDMDGLIEI